MAGVVFEQYAVLLLPVLRRIAVFPTSLTAKDDASLLLAVWHAQLPQICHSLHGPAPGPNGFRRGAGWADFPVGVQLVSGPPTAKTSAFAAGEAIEAGGHAVGL